MSEIASAFVTLIPSFKGGANEIAQQLDGPSVAAGKSSGTKLSGALGSVLKKSVLGVGAAAGGILGTALFKGFNRLTAIEDAKAKLEGLGNSAKTVTAVMDNALAAVKGTAFGLDEAATVAAGAVAAGIKPGKQLESTLKLVADAATIGGSSLSEMGAIFNKVATSNKVQGDVINQLNDQGIPIVQLLAKTMGKTSDEVTKLASKGKIDFATFSKAMQSGLGGAALKSGNTTTGALKNVGAAFGRFGAQILSGVFPLVKVGAGKITSTLDAIGPKIGPGIAALSAKFKAFLPTLLQLGNQLKGPLTAALTSLKNAFVTVAPSVKALAKTFGPLIAKAAGAALIAIAVAAQVLGAALEKVAPVVAGIFNFLANNKDAVLTFVAIAGGAQLLALAFLGVSKAIQFVRFGLIALQLIIAANPFTLIIIGIAAFAAALVVAYQHSAVFRAIVNAAFTAVKVVAGAVFSFLSSAVTGTIDFIQSHWKLLLGILTGPIGAATIFVISHWSQIRGATSAAFNAVKGVISGALGAAKSAVTSGISSIVRTFTGLLGRIKGALSGSKTALVGIGKNIVQGLIDGIQKMGSKIKDALLALLPGPLKKFAGKLGIASPSKVFKGFGINIGQGLVLGIDSQRATVTAASDRLAASVSMPTAARFTGNATTAKAADGSADGQPAGLTREEMLAALASMKIILGRREFAAAVRDANGTIRALT